MQIELGRCRHRKCLSGRDRWVTVSFPFTPSASSVASHNTQNVGCWKFSLFSDKKSLFRTQNISATKMSQLEDLKMEKEYCLIELHWN